MMKRKDPADMTEKEKAYHGLRKITVNGPYEDEIDAHLSGDAIFKRRIFVFELYVRVFHWVLFFLMIVLIATGFWLDWAAPSTAGDTTNKFWYGAVRYTHVLAGYLLAVAFLLRLWQAVVGNVWSRQVFMIPVLRKKFYTAVWDVMLEYSFLDNDPPRKWVGHNPMSQMSMGAYMILLAVTLISGFVVTANMYGPGHWSWPLFAWMIPLWGGPAQALAYHELLMWLNIGFILIHMYMVVREDIMSRQSITATIFNGWRDFKDDMPSKIHHEEKPVLAGTKLESEAPKHGSPAE